MSKIYPDPDRLVQWRVCKKTTKAEWRKPMGVWNVCVDRHHSRLILDEGPASENLHARPGSWDLDLSCRALGKFGRGEIIKLMLWKDHSGDEVPNGLVKGRAVIPQGCNQDLSCKRKFLSCKFGEGGTLETILTSINREMKQLRGSELGNISIVPS